VRIRRSQFTCELERARGESLMKPNSEFQFVQAEVVPHPQRPRFTCSSPSRTHTRGMKGTPASAPTKGTTNANANNKAAAATKPAAASAAKGAPAATKKPSGK
jgi:hypothetical protein